MMAVNERLLQMLMQKNPELSFAIEQSLPLKSTYAEAASLGPFMEIAIHDPQNALTSQRAAQSVNYWRTTTRQLLSDHEAAESRPVRLIYGKMAAEQAALLLSRSYPDEAEETFRFATEICPACPVAIYRYVSMLTEQKRFDDAIEVAKTAATADVENQHHFAKLLAELNKLKKK